MPSFTRSSSEKSKKVATIFKASILLFGGAIKKLTIRFLTKFLDKNRIRKNIFYLDSIYFSITPAEFLRLCAALSFASFKC